MADEVKPFKSLKVNWQWTTKSFLNNISNKWSK